MNKEDAVKIIVLLLNRATLNAAEVYAANEALKTLQAEPAQEKKAE